MQEGRRRKQSRNFDDSEGDQVQGRWTREEHQRFVEALSIHGKNWKKVEEYVGSRSGAQIRSHAQKFFNRLEKEFHQQFNGLKSSEIKQIFENKSFHKYYETDQQKRLRSGSFNDLVSDEDMIPQESQQESIMKDIQKVPYASLRDKLLPPPMDMLNQDIIKGLPINILEMITEYNKQQLTLKTRLSETATNNQIPPNELINDIYQLRKQKDDITRCIQFKEAYQSLDMNSQQEQEDVSNNNLNQSVDKSINRPAPDQSFFHFIIQKYQNYFHKSNPKLSDFIVEPKNDVTEPQEEFVKSRKQSFTFYNEQDEEANEQKYKSLKKVKKELFDGTN